MKVSVKKSLVIISLSFLISCQDQQDEKKVKKTSPIIQHQYDKDLDLIPDAVDLIHDKTLKSLPYFYIKKMNLKLINGDVEINEPSQWIGLIKNNLQELNPGVILNHPAIFTYARLRQLKQISIEYSFQDRHEGINIFYGDFICGNKEIYLNCAHNKNDKTITIDLPDNLTYENIKIYFTDYSIHRKNPELTLTDREYFQYIQTSPHFKIVNFQNIYIASVLESSQNNLINILQNTDFGPYENIENISIDERMAWAYGHPSLHFKQIYNETIISLPSQMQNKELKNSVQNESSNIEITKHSKHKIYFHINGVNKTYQQKILHMTDENSSLLGNSIHFAQQLVRNEQIMLDALLLKVEVFYENRWRKLKDFSKKIHVIDEQSIILNLNSDKIILRLARRNKSHWVGIFSAMDNQLRRRGNRRSINLLLERHQLNYPTETQLTLEYFLF